MTVDEALALLGVSRDASADEVRRAYLRACKRHRPESDPEGFQRVRAAYDRLTGVGQPSAPATTSGVEVAAVATVTVEPPVRAPLPPMAPEPRPQDLASAWASVMAQPTVPARWRAWSARVHRAALGELTDERLIAMARELPRALAKLQTELAGVALVPALRAPCATVALHLFARRAAEQADALLSAVSAFERGAGDADWTVARELGAIVAMGSDDLAQALASFVVRGDPDAAWKALGRVPVAQLHPDRMQHLAPTLNDMFGDLRRLGRPPSRARVIAARVMIGVVVGTLALLVGASMCNTPKPRREVAPAVAPAAPARADAHP